MAARFFFVIVSILLTREIHFLRLSESWNSVGKVKSWKGGSQIQIPVPKLTWWVGHTFFCQSSSVQYPFEQPLTQQDRWPKLRLISVKMIDWNTEIKIYVSKICLYWTVLASRNRVKLLGHRTVHLENVKCIYFTDRFFSSKSYYHFEVIIMVMEYFFANGLQNLTHTHPSVLHFLSFKGLILVKGQMRL